MFFSIIIGIISGILYGLSFVMQRKALVYYFDHSNDYKFIKKEKIKTFLFSIIRVLSLIILFYLLLLRPTNLIIILISFLLTFWLVILKSERII